MSHLPAGTWLATGVITLIAVLAALHALASLVRDQRASADLKRRVVALRTQSAERAAADEAGDGEIVNVDVVGEPAPQASKKAA